MLLALRFPVVLALAGPAATSAGTGLVVVLRSGSVLEVLSVTPRGALILVEGRDGVLYSLRAKDVQGLEAPGPDGAPGPPAQPPAPGRRARPGHAAPGSFSVLPGPRSVEPPAGRASRGGLAGAERSWRARAARLREKVAEARAGLEGELASRNAAGEAAVRSESRVWWSSRGGRAQVRRDEAERRLERAREAVARAEGALDRLLREAREAGVPPGWTR